MAATKKVKLFEIDHDYLRLIKATNHNGFVFVPRAMGIAGWKSLDRLEKAGKIYTVKGKYVTGYRISK